MERLFHLLERGAFEALRASGAQRYAPESLAREGFVHLSFAGQLAGTLATHFAHASELFLVEIELAPGSAGVAIEPSRGGAGFPHLHRALERAELARAWLLARRGDEWLLPRLGAGPGTDRPPGGPVG